MLLSSGPWSSHQLVLTPFVGWFVTVTISYYLNAFLLTMTQVFWVLVGIGIIGAAVTLARRKSAVLNSGDRWLALSALVGVFLFFIAVLPHAREGSLGLLALNVDEELYYPYAEHIKHSPATMEGAADGPFLDLMKSDRFKSRGQGFAYTLSISSIVSRTPTFLAYMPTIYLLLGLSAVSVFLFARVGLELGPKASFLSAGFYGLNGLPLWFSSMGFGPHTVAFALLPLAFAGVIAAMRHGGARPAIFAGWASAILLASYFWGISAIFLATAGPLTLILALATRPRARRIRTALAIALAGVAAGFPALFWFAKWALPQLTTITNDLNGLFGNAWGDLTFPAPQTSIGLRAYHMVHDAPGMELLLGSGIWNAVQHLEVVAWIGFLALAALALVKPRGDRLPPLILAVTFVGFGLWVWRGTGYQYGYFKTLSYVSFFGETVLAAGLAVAWAGVSGSVRAGTWRDIARRWANRGLRFSTVAIFLFIGGLTAVNTVQTLRWYWAGFSWNMPGEIVHEARRIAKSVTDGGTVRLSTHMQYPFAPGGTKFRPITLAFHYESAAQRRRNARTAAVLAAEMYGRNFYTAGRTPGFKQDIASMPSDPDYFVLGSQQDPRIHGLLLSENRTPGGKLALYAYRPADIMTSSQISESFGGSNFFAKGRPFTANVGADGISSERQAAGTAAPTDRQILLGVLNPSSDEIGIRVEIGDETTVYPIRPGLHWIVSDPRSVPYRVYAEPEGDDSIQIFLARAIDAGTAVARSLTADARSSSSVRVDVDGRTIRAVVSFANPGLGGVNVGATFQESTTHGYWVSGAPLPSPAQVISLEYSVARRELTESINGTVVKSTVSRDSDFPGRRRFELVFAHSDERIFRFPLFEYRVTDGEIEILWTPSEPYVFVLPRR